MVVEKWLRLFCNGAVASDNGAENGEQRQNRCLRRKGDEKGLRENWKRQRNGGTRLRNGQIGMGNGQKGMRNSEKKDEGGRWKVVEGRWRLFWPFLGRGMLTIRELRSKVKGGGIFSFS